MENFSCAFIHVYVYVYFNFVKEQGATVVCWKTSSRIKWYSYNIKSEASSIWGLFIIIMMQIDTYLSWTIKIATLIMVNSLSNKLYLQL